MQYDNYFISNKYTKWYFSIISNAKTRLTVSGYTEAHHILPRSLSGGNEEANIVILTAKEHFICHMLLRMMCKHREHKNSMVFAAWLLANAEDKNQERYKVTGRTYAILKSDLTQARSLANKAQLTCEHGNKTMDFRNYAQYHGERCKLNPDPNAIGPLKYKCEHCDKNVSPQNYHQYHGDKCKAIPTNGTHKRSTSHQKKLDDAAKNRKKKHCVFCGSNTSPHIYSKYHGNNCRHKRCDHCNIFCSPSKYITDHGVKCKSIT
jgi:hypothetical protein